MSHFATTIKEALESADAAIWDKYYGKGLSVEYARSVHNKIKAALTALELLEKKDAQ